MIGFVMGSKVGRMIAAALGFLVVLALMLGNAKRKGKKEARHEMQVKDRQTADAIRERVRVARGRSVRSDEIIYRD